MSWIVTFCHARMPRIVSIFSLVRKDPNKKRDFGLFADLLFVVVSRSRHIGHGYKPGWSHQVIVPPAPLWSYHWAYDGWRFCCDGSSTFLLAFLVSSWKMNGKAEGWWIGTSPCYDERTIALRTNALRAYEGKSSELVISGKRWRCTAVVVPLGIWQLENWLWREFHFFCLRF